MITYLKVYLARFQNMIMAIGKTKSLTPFQIYLFRQYAHAISP